MVSDRGTDAGAKSRIEQVALAHDYQEHHSAVAGATWGWLFDHDRFLDLRERAEYAIDLAGTDSNATHVHCAVGAAVHACRASGRDFDQVSVCPHSGVLREVGRVGSLARSIAVTA